MSEKRYYWLKLKEDFFESNDIQVVEAMPSGKDFIIFYLKLLCKSIRHEGNLRLTAEIPYNEETLAAITHTDVNVVKQAIQIFSGLHLIELMDDGTYFMSRVQDMLGSETKWAEKKRIYRGKQQLLEGQTEDNVLTMSDKSIDIRDKSIEIDIEQEQEIEGNIIPAENHPPYKEIVDYLNNLAGTNYRASSKKTQHLIKARINEGFTLEDFRVVIEKKTREWINDNKMKAYLRPETLFGTKFEGYLNQPVKELTTKDLTPYTDFSEFYTN